MRTRKALIKSASCLFLSVLFLGTMSLSAYEPPSSKDLFDKEERPKNLTIKNKSGFIGDLTGAMGASMDFKRPITFSYTGSLGLGYRFAISTWNLWDVALEFSTGLGGVSEKDIVYLFSPTFRLGYGAPINRGMNFFTYLGAGGSLAAAAMQKPRFAPGGYLGFQLEILASQVFRVIVGPRFGLKTAYDSTNTETLSLYFVPELNAGIRLKL